MTGIQAQCQQIQSGIDRVLTQDLWIEPILPNKNGTMTPPERPGHGLAFRPEVLKDYRIGGQSITA